MTIVDLLVGHLNPCGTRWIVSSPGQKCTLPMAITGCSFAKCSSSDCTGPTFRLSNLVPILFNLVPMFICDYYGFQYHFFYSPYQYALEYPSKHASFDDSISCFDHHHRRDEYNHRHIYVCTTCILQMLESRIFPEEMGLHIVISCLLLILLQYLT